jgi:hypothetical protein
MILKDLDEYKYLFLKNINTNDENGLTICLNVGRVSEETEPLVFNGVIINDTRPILEDNTVSLKVGFTSYIAYNVRWESYTCWSDYDEFTGRLVREYSKSRYLEYVKTDTFASDEWPGKLRHFGICCEWEIIDIISIDEPQVQLIDKLGE